MGGVIMGGGLGDAGNTIYYVALTLGILIFVYPFLLYPVLLSLILRRAQTLGAPTMPREFPNVVMVICALNEQNVIRQKLENSLALDYPFGKLRIVVVSDGSTDGTAAVAREYAAMGVELIEQKQRRGKAANLNEVLSKRQEDIVVLSDANVLYDSRALWHLVSRFEDPSVGCVSGRVVLTGTTELLRACESDYYSVEWHLQQKASILYSMAGADGAMYALRRHLFRACPDDTLIEDFAISMGVVRQGKRVVFEPNAVGWESGPASLKEEFQRKVRIAAGATQALLRGTGWPGQVPLRFWFVFLSHKLLRWISPVLGMLVLTLACLSWPHPLAQVVAAGSLVLAALAAMRLLTSCAHPIFETPFYFLFGQVALMLGLLKGATRGQSVLWAKVDR